jgi:hypothetical protein
MHQSLVVHNNYVNLFPLFGPAIRPCHSSAGMGWATKLVSSWGLLVTHLQAWAGPQNWSPRGDCWSLICRHGLGHKTGLLVGTVGHSSAGMGWATKLDSSWGLLVTHLLAWAGPQNWSPREDCWSHSCCSYCSLLPASSAQRIAIKKYYLS